MRRTSTILVVAAVVVSVACVAAMAADVPNRPPGQGRVYLKADIWRGVADRVVPLPAPEDPGNGLEASGKLAGPVSLGTHSATPRLDTVRGSAIPSAGGTQTFMTPAERTKVQIQRLIRKLG